MKYEITEITEKKCFGIEKHVTKEKLEKGVIFNEIWKPFIEATDYANTEETYGVAKNFKMHPKEYDYIACAENGTTIFKDLEFKKVIVPGGAYAKFTYKGIKTPERIGKFYDDVFLFSVTSEEFKVDRNRGINCFELYDSLYKGGKNPDSVCYLLIPIIK